MGKNNRNKSSNQKNSHSKQINRDKNNKNKYSTQKQSASFRNHQPSHSRSRSNTKNVPPNKKSNNKNIPKNLPGLTNSNKPNKKQELIDPMNPMKSLKKLTGNSAFKIVTQGFEEDSEDQFAALGGSQEEQVDQEFHNQEEDEYEGEQEIEPQDEDDDQYEDEEFIEADDDDQEFEQGEGNEEQDYQEDEDQIEEEDDERDGEIQQEEEMLEEGEQIEQLKYEGDEDDEDDEEQIKGEGIKLQGDEQEDKNVDISVINLKIQETLSVLMNVNRLGQGKPRKYFIEKLKKYAHQYYGYNFELIDHFMHFLNPTEMVQFFEANETQRPLTIRTNTLKTRRKDLAQALIQRGVNLDPLADWSKDGIKIYDTKVPIGATPEYLAGHYMLQSASSFLPVLALDPQMHEKVLDMAAAPGGKTSYIAQLMKNTGSIFANDLKKERLRALQFNLYRLGITNTVVTCRDGRKYSKIFPNTFDKVLLDSPCTGLGIISKDMSIKANRVAIDIYKNSHIQKELILSAIDSAKVGGIIVYSTCSVSPLENQEVVNFALKKRHVKIVDVNELIEIGQMGLTKFIDKRYHTDLRKTKRIYPHVHNMDGFYFAKLVKTANGKKVDEKAKKESQEMEEAQ